MSASLIIVIFSITILLLANALSKHSCKILEPEIWIYQKHLLWYVTTNEALHVHSLVNGPYPCDFFLMSLYGRLVYMLMEINLF